MTAELDLNLYPLYRIKGQEWPQIPGLLGASPPKRPGRGREEDHLLLYLALSGNVPFSSAEYTQLMGELAARFYKTSGSLTTAIRATAEALNRFLLNRNMRTTGKGQYLVGRMILGVLRDRQFTFAQCGPTHAFHLSREGAHHFHDEQAGGRGLGTSQATPLYLAKADLHPGDLLVMCSDLPSGWEALLATEQRTAPDALHRKLMALHGDDLNAVLLQAQGGRGAINMLKWTDHSAVRSTSSASQAVKPAQAGEIPAGQAAAGAFAEGPRRPVTSHISSGQPAGRFAQAMGAGVAAASAGASTRRENAQGSTSPSPAETSVKKPVQPPVVTASTARQQARTPGRSFSLFHARGGRGRFGVPTNPSALPEIKRPLSPGRRQAYRGAGQFIHNMRETSHKIGEAVKNFLPNLLPGMKDGGAGSSGMAILAILIPIVIVIIGSSVYLNYGRTTQYQGYYQQAAAQAEQARTLTDAVDVRRAWDTTIYYLDLAEKNQKTQQSQDLRQEAQTALDGLDGITRLEFTQAIIGSLSRTVVISQMAATDTDIYLLDASRGDVIRAYSTDSGYQVDSAFHCEPGPNEDENGNSLSVGPLVDILTLPLSNVYNARVLGMDANGSLLYCGLNDPIAASLVKPQLGWHELTAFTLDSDGKELYVLDPQGNAIWEYSGNQGKWSDLPIIFFGEQVPQNMEQVIDLAANNSDMYLLFQDGHVSACPLWRYDVAPMRCADPVTFIDSRPERQSGTYITDAVFTQVTFAYAPDPSLYMLEPLTRAIYRFSPRADSLDLRGQFRSAMQSGSSQFSGSAGAMAIGPNRYVFISIGSQVYYAADVP